MPTLDTNVDKSKEPSKTVVASLIKPQNPLHTKLLDLLNKDLLENKRARATGFIGNN